jgi:dolichol-phosphate mannosyltransferase
LIKTEVRLREAQGRVLITMDGDGQNDPADIPKLIHILMTTDSGMAVGVRANRKDGWVRKRMSRVANTVRQGLLNDGVRDSGCALKAFHREVCTAFIPIRTLYSFMPALAVAAGFQVFELEVNHRPRERGVSKYSFGIMLWRPLIDMLGVWWFTQRRFQEVAPNSSPCSC